MLASLVGAVLIVGLVVGPLLWRVWDDRRVENALRVRADLHMVLFRALQGDSRARLLGAAQALVVLAEHLGVPYFFFVSLIVTFSSL